MSSWTTWRGRAIEPVVREAPRRLQPGKIPDTAVIGGYWTRTNDPEIDVVGADRGPIAKRITMVGSIKWLGNKRFDNHDLARLLVHRDRLPGANESTPLLAVTRGPAELDGVTMITAADLITAWR